MIIKTIDSIIINHPKDCDIQPGEPKVIRDGKGTPLRLITNGTLKITGKMEDGKDFEIEYTVKDLAIKVDGEVELR